MAEGRGGFFDLAGSRYLLIVDYFSKYVEIQLMKGTTSTAVINAFKVVYSRHGIPDELITDQGPPFNSKEMADFHASWGIIHNPSSPYNPRSNGQAERTIQTLKGSMNKAFEDGKDVNLVLLDYRTTPANDLPSPSELLMGRRLKTLLPTHPARLRPNFPIDGAKRNLLERQNGQKKYANNKTKKLLALNKGDKVWFRLEMKKPWVTGSIAEVRPHRTYLILASNGSKYVRNRFYIRLASADRNVSAASTKSPGLSSNLVPTNSDAVSVPTWNLGPPQTVSSNPAQSASSIPTRCASPGPVQCSSSTVPESSSQVSARTRSGRAVRPPARYLN